MTQKNKKLLLKELCARLPYGVICDDGYGNVLELNGIDKPNTVTFKCSDNTFCTTDLDKCKPYLFPLSSMTDDIKNFIRWKLTTPKYDSFDEESLEDLFNNNMQVVQFCYEHHLDINGLIERGLALEAPEGMYN